jgi:PAS domain S-box-containing protein
MANLPTMPRRSGLERFSLALAWALLALGTLCLSGWLLHIDSLTQPRPDIAPIRPNVAVCLMMLGAALVASELGWRRFAWLALIPAGLGLTTLVEYVFKSDFGIDELIALDRMVESGAAPGRMPVMAAGSILLCGGLLALQAFGGSNRWRIFANAVAGSIVASVGFSTLLGYAVSLPAVYHWGTATATSPITAVGLLLVGLALLSLAWRENLKREGAPPVWSPMPAVIACLTLTVVLWIGLRERELVYLGTNTTIALQSVATNTGLQFDRQVAEVERLAQNWAQVPDGNAASVWEMDALLFLRDAPGAVSVAWVSPAFTNRWVYPSKGNETEISYDHASDPVRRAALETARSKGTSAVTGSLTLPLLGKGFAIYAPVRRNGQLVGYVSAEYLYRGFFAAIDRSLKVSGSYDVAISVGDDVVFDSFNAGTAHNDDLAVANNFTIAERRVRISLAPSDDFLAHNRRSLPEFALLAGFGITILLGLSVHLARTARAGMFSAEQSNRRLIAENEERRRIEARLKVSDERLRLALDSTQIGIFEWNVPAGHVYYSPGLWAMLGYEHVRMPPTVEAWQSLIHPDDLKLYHRRVEAQLSGATAFIDPEYRVRTRNGEWRWVYSRSKSVASSTSGIPTRIIGTVQDVTARREAEEALRASQAATRKLSLVAARTDNLVIIGAVDGRIEWVNESFSRVMEYGLEEVVGRNPVDFMLGPETSGHTVLRIRAAMSRGRGISTDIVNYSKSGRKYHLQLEIQPVRNDAGELENFIAMLADITARVETEQALRRAKQEADAASRAKSEFLASMSHEIRTPMNGVIGMTSLLLETTLNAEQRDFVNTIRTSGEALLAIINDILDFSKIESGKLELEHLPFELTVCLEEALDLFAVQAAGKNLDLAYVVAPEVPPWLLGDVTRLRQVLVNLINNAVKFTPTGSIAIEVRRVPGEPGHIGRIRLEFTVRDTGIGIPADRTDRLFKAFSQVDSSTTRKYGGTGLGLAICQRLCALMGGSIRVESKVGEGSAFIFTLETAAAMMPGDSLAPVLPASLRAGRVLVIEDYPITQQRLKNFFESAGATCHVASSAAQALALASQLPTPPSLLVIDQGDEEGDTLLKTLAPLRAPRLVMMPFGQGAPEFPADGHAYGVISKPLKTSSLIQAVSTLMSVEAKPATSPNVAPGPRLLGKEIPLDILLAEDNPVNQKVALRFLERLGYRADAVGNGVEALSTLASRRYDLVLMDLQMPEMDGLEASRQIRATIPPDRQPKIIALTANALQGDRELCLSAGMDDYITKPVKLHEIEEAIRRQFAPQSKNIEFIG